MKINAAKPGLTALDIINPNVRISGWLAALAANGSINKETLEDGLLHFGLKRSAAAWLLFLQRFSILLGVLLFVAGLIFFMAWNWEDLSRFAKFGIVEGVFAIFGVYSLLRWPRKGSARQGWDARIALLGAAITIGGMLALYGQIYQTGADAWELFRAWTFMLVVLAIPGRVTVFWFMVWLVGSTWLSLYLGTSANFARWSDEIHILVLYVAMAQFAMLAANEAASRILAKRGFAHDAGRWLSRIIGCVAITMMLSFALSYLVMDEAGKLSSIFYGIYALSLAATFIVYYKLIPELLFLSLCIFSAAIFIATKFSKALLESSNVEAGTFLIIGLMILGLAFGSLKLILMLRKDIRARVQKEPAETPETTASAGEHSLGLFKNRAARQAELKNWLLARNAAEAEAIDAFYADDDAAQDLESPWYAKLFITIGVWIGSAVSLAAFTFLMFEGLHSPQPLGVVGIILCGLAVHMGHGKRLSVQAFSQILGICGLLYAACLFEFEKDPTAILLALLFGFFWLLKPPFAARLGAFMGMLISIFTFLGLYYYRSSDWLDITTYIKTAIYTLGLLWAVHFLVVMGGRAPARLQQPSGEWLRKRFNASEALSSSAYACLIFFAGLAVVGPERVLGAPLFILNFNMGTVIVFAALTGLMAWRYPSVRLTALLLGLPLTGLAWFAPYLSLGFGLLLLAFHTGKNAFLGAATAYLGCGVYIYYYNLAISLLDKSLVLMGCGAFFLALGLILARMGAKERLQ